MSQAQAQAPAKSGPLGSLKNFFSKKPAATPDELAKKQGFLSKHLFQDLPPTAMQIQAGFLCAILNHILEIKDPVTISAWKSALEEIVKEPKKKRANIAQSCVLELRPDRVPYKTLTKQYNELIDIFKDFGKQNNGAEDLVNKHRASLLRLKYSICHIENEYEAGKRLLADAKAREKAGTSWWTSWSKEEQLDLSDDMMKIMERTALQQRAAATVQEITEILNSNKNRNTTSIANATLLSNLKEMVNNVLVQIQEDEKFMENDTINSLVQNILQQGVNAPIKNLQDFLWKIQAELKKISNPATRAAPAPRE